jgi:hypothetical protein
MNSQTTVLAFTLVLYILIMAAFNKARKKYSGGKIGVAINLILITVVLLFVSEYVRFLHPWVDVEVTSTLETLFKTIALSFLAYGGVRIAGR